VRSEVESILEADHAELDTLLERTFRAIESADCREVYLALDYFWARLAMHIRAEHLRLFPAVREIAESKAEADGGVNFDDIPQLLEQLRHDHDFFMTELARAIKALRLVFSFGNEADTLSIVGELTHQVSQRLIAHNEVEEKRIYTLISAEFLAPEAIGELKLSIDKELSNLPQRFRQASAPS
jgi:hypothetical protein